MLQDPNIARRAPDPAGVRFRVVGDLDLPHDVIGGLGQEVELGDCFGEGEEVGF